MAVRLRLLRDLEAWGKRDVAWGDGRSFVVPPPLASDARSMRASPQLRVQPATGSCAPSFRFITNRQAGSLASVS